MTTSFRRLVRSLWGDSWKPKLTSFLAHHGYTPSRMTIWRWDNDKAPEPVITLLKREQRPTKRRPRHGGKRPVVKLKEEE